MASMTNDTAPCGIISVSMSDTLNTSNEIGHTESYWYMYFVNNDARD